MHAWEDEKTAVFLAKFGDEIIHGEELDEYLHEIWYPEFFISNAETPRTVHYKTLDVLDGKFELFERFDAELSIDAEMPKYPFGDLDLFLDIASFSGNKQKMVFYPESIIAHVHVNHGFLDALQKILFPIFSIVFLSLLMNHFYPSGNYDIYNWRIGGQLTLFLTIPALKFSLAGELPTTHYLNFTDALFIWATVVVTYNMMIGIISHYKMANEGANTGRSIERFARISSPLVAVLVVGVLLSYIF